MDGISLDWDNMRRARKAWPLVSVDWRACRLWAPCKTNSAASTPTRNGCCRQVLNPHYVAMTSKLSYKGNKLKLAIPRNPRSGPFANRITKPRRSSPATFLPPVHVPSLQFGTSVPEGPSPRIYRRIPCSQATPQNVVLQPHGSTAPR